MDEEDGEGGIGAGCEEDVVISADDEGSELASGGGGFTI